MQSHQLKIASLPSILLAGTQITITVTQLFSNKKGTPTMRSPFCERVTGVEPAALGLGSRCSTTELHPQNFYKDKYFS